MGGGVGAHKAKAYEWSVEMRQKCTKAREKMQNFLRFCKNWHLAG